MNDGGEPIQLESTDPIAVLSPLVGDVIQLTSSVESTSEPDSEAITTLFGKFQELIDSDPQSIEPPEPPANYEHYAPEELPQTVSSHIEESQEAIEEYLLFQCRITSEPCTASTVRKGVVALQGSVCL